MFWFQFGWIQVECYVHQCYIQKNNSINKLENTELLSECDLFCFSFVFSKNHRIHRAVLSFCSTTILAFRPQWEFDVLLNSLTRCVVDKTTIECSRQARPKTLSQFEHIFCVELQTKRGDSAKHNRQVWWIAYSWLALFRATWYGTADSFGSLQSISKLFSTVYKSTEEECWLRTEALRLVFYEQMSNIKFVYIGMGKNGLMC